MMTASQRANYQVLWASCSVNSSSQAEAEAEAQKILDHRERYQAVVEQISPLLPWAFVGVLHMLESSGRFDRHLHNGDPLTSRTTHVPAGRPLVGEPPFTWEESALDDITLLGFGSPLVDWSTEGILYNLERHNGFGYQHRGVNSPYLWAGSNHYVKGKFVVDGRYDPELVSKQIGGAVLLKAMEIHTT